MYCNIMVSPAHLLHLSSKTWNGLSWMAAQDKEVSVQALIYDALCAGNRREWATCMNDGLRLTICDAVIPALRCAHANEWVSCMIVNDMGG